MTDPIKAKIIEAVPGIYRCNVCRKEYKEDCFMNHTGQEVSRPITLADVLRAIGKHSSGIYEVEQVAFYGELFTFIVRRIEDGYITHTHWNLALDFDQQEDEVKQFIGRVLGVTE